MIIDTDVAIIAKHFGLDPNLIQSVVNAEGNIIKAVQCSFPSVTTRKEALEITCRSAVHAMSDLVKKSYFGEFINFWASRWAPPKVVNDPTNLNANWPRNVLKLWMSV